MVLESRPGCQGFLGFNFGVFELCCNLFGPPKSPSSRNRL